MLINGGLKGPTPILGCPIAGQSRNLSRISYAEVDPKSGICAFPAFNPFIESVVNDLRTVFGESLQFSPNALKLIEGAAKQEEMYRRRYLKPEFQFKTKPYAHQTESLLFSIYRPRSALALSCGTGKSKVAIDTMSYLGCPTLLIVPASLISNWIDELETHSLREFRTVVVDDTSAKKKKEKLGLFGEGDEKRNQKINADLLIVSYDTARIYYETIFNNFDYRMVICDESHKVANFQANRTKAVLQLGEKVHRRVIMSGTMVLGSPENVYPQFRFLCPHILNQDYYAFRKTYLQFATYNPHIVVGTKSLPQLNRRISSHLKRYTKEECLDLPERVVVDKKFELTDEQKKMYADILSDENLYLPEDLVIDKTYKISALGKLSQLTSGFLYLSNKRFDVCNDCQNVLDCVERGQRPYRNGCAIYPESPPTVVKRMNASPKLDLAMEIIEDILQDPENKVLVWARYAEEIEMLRERLEKAEIKCVFVSKDPATELREFNDPSSPVKVCVCNIDMGTGFTANAAAYTLFFSMSFNYANISQANDRNYRIGQKKKVIVYRLAGKNSIDEDVVKALNNKEDIIEVLLKKLPEFREQWVTAKSSKRGL